MIGRAVSCCSEGQTVSDGCLDKPFGIDDCFNNGLSLCNSCGHRRRKCTASAMRILGVNPFGANSQAFAVYRYQQILCIVRLLADVRLSSRPFLLLTAKYDSRLPQHLHPIRSSSLLALLLLEYLGVMTEAIGIKNVFNASTASSNKREAPPLAIMTGSIMSVGEP